MNSMTSPSGLSAPATVAGPSATSRPEDRRRHERFPVTVPARVLHDGRTHRTEILDLSDGGMLLAPVAALLTAQTQIIHIDTAVLGRIEARIVSVTRIGIHVKIELTQTAYQAGLERLIALTRTWSRLDVDQAGGAAEA